MKKLTIVAAIVCAATFANAAAIDWSASKVYDAVETAAQGKNIAANGWLGYVIMEADYSTVTGDLAAGKTDSLTTKAVGPQKATTNKGAFVESTPSGSVAAGTQNFYLIVLNSTTLENATGFAVSAKTSAEIDASLDSLIAFGSMESATKNVSNWTTMSVPEPTSGLLLLLGVAGLALKRKRA